jgi:hypothetical protein
LTPRTRSVLVAAACATGAWLAAGCHGTTHYIGTDCIGSGVGADLQTAIDQRKTVLLCPGAQITLAKPLLLRQGLTLVTADQPTEPAQMATLILGPDFPPQGRAAIAGSGGDIHLAAVRFDGNRRTIGPRDDQTLLELGPGTDYSVEGCVFTDSASWTHLHLVETCDSATITGNTIESAARPHDDSGHKSDGLSISCAHSLVENNHINDISSVGIVYFGGAGTIIRNNTITETSTSASSGINVGDAVVADHTGVIVEGNHLIAKGPRYFQNGIAAGLHVLGKTASVSGVTFRGNTLQGMAVYGLAVDGCLDCTVQDNDVSGWHPLPPLDLCPAPAAYLAAVTAGHASGVLQVGATDAKIDGCHGEAEVLGALYRTYAGDNRFPDYQAFEVQLYSQRMEQNLDALGILRGAWDQIAARAKTICPAGTAADLQTVWRRLADAQFGAGLSAVDAEARVRADLTTMPVSATCS